MPDAVVTKEPKQERTGMERWPGSEGPLFRGGLFNVNPFALMRQFTEDMDRAFSKTPKEAAWTPPIEVKRKNGSLLVTAELPGVKKEDVHVTIDGATLTLEGERKEEKEEKREGYYHSERSYGKFLRSIPLPEGAQAENAAAEFKDGVLEITVPCPDTKLKAQEVPVK